MFYLPVNFAAFYDYDRTRSSLTQDSRSRQRQGEEEKERGSQLRRHVANCRALRWNRSQRWKRLREERSGPAGRAKRRKRTMYVAAVRRSRYDGEARWKAEAAGNLWFKESDPSCDMPGFNRRHLFVKSVPKDSPRRSSTSSPRPSLVRFSDCLRAGTTKPAGP